MNSIALPSLNRLSLLNKDTGLSRYKNSCNPNENDNLNYISEKISRDVDISKYRLVFEENSLIKNFLKNSKIFVEPKNQIQFTKDIIGLSDGWDGIGSKGFSDDFLLETDIFINNLYKTDISILGEMSVSPSYEGTIVVSWINKDYSLSIELYANDINNYFSFIKWGLNNEYLVKMDGVFSRDIFESILSLIH